MSRRLTLTGDRRGELPRCHVDHRARITPHSDPGLTWLVAHRSSRGAHQGQRLTGHSVAHRAQGRRSSSLARWGSRAHTREGRDVERMIFSTFERPRASTSQRHSVTASQRLNVTAPQRLNVTAPQRHSATAPQRHSA